MNVSRLIAKKRDGEELATAEIEFLIKGFSKDNIPDYQMSAMAMAILFRGMNSRETTDLTRAMLHSGEQFEWNQFDSDFCKVDKHSTGGVGDKISIVLAPLMACFDLHVPMISGRGLGPTGGTLDKLESIPGFDTGLTEKEIYEAIVKAKCVITGATDSIAPADKKLYALRDVTATVESIPLITASILSKKLAANLDALVLDVKFGSGAFMSSIEKARELAKSLVSVGNRLGTKTTAFLTDMNQPLGKMIGNANEIAESIDVLKGGGPDDIRELTIGLCANLLVAAKICDSEKIAKERLAKKLDSGEALTTFEAMVKVQKGDLERFDSNWKQNQKRLAVTSPKSGIIQSIDARALGYAIIELGGGRKCLTDSIDHDVGIQLHKKIGDTVNENDLLCEMIGQDCVDDLIVESIRDAFQVGQSPVDVPSLIVDVINDE